FVDQQLIAMSQARRPYRPHPLSLEALCHRGIDRHGMTHSWRNEDLALRGKTGQSWRNGRLCSYRSEKPSLESLSTPDVGDAHQCERTVRKARYIVGSERVDVGGLASSESALFGGPCVRYGEREPQQHRCDERCEDDTGRADPTG